MITPPFLSTGDSIGIVAPAGIVDPEKLIKGIRTLESWGYHVIRGKFLLDNFYRFSSKDENRLSDLQIMFDNPEIKAIFAGRGGYGIVRIIDSLSFDKFINHPKWFIGFSDLTMLHAYINKLGIESIHGPMASHLDTEYLSEPALIQLRNILAGGKNTHRFPTHPLSKHGVASGELTGGNLSMICSNTGTYSDFDTAGKIMLIEDINEHHYHIDRMMWQMKRSGKLENLSALIVGDFTDPRDDPSVFGKTCYEIVADALSCYDYPVLYGFPAGHEYDNRPLILGRMTQINIDNQSSSIYQ